MEKEMKARIVHKHDIEANWLKASGFVPKQGEIIIYDEDSNCPYERIKIGDGINNVNILPFAHGASMVVQSGAPSDTSVLWVDLDDDTSEELLGVARYITPEMYGAKGDGTTDDSAAIQAAIDAAGSTSSVYLANKTYRIATGLVVNTSYAQFKCDGTLEYSGTDAAITIANCYRTNVYVHIITAPNGTAVKLDGFAGNVTSCNVEVHVIRSSKIGVYLYTNSKSICYNTIRSTHLNATETGVKVWADASYINENRYYIDHIAGSCTYGIYLHSDSTLAVANGFGTNDNKFFAVGLEGMATDGCAICIERSYGNIFRDMRCAEGYGSKQVKFIGECKHNEVELNRVILTKIDISELADIGGDFNVLRSQSISANDHRAGTEARVSKRHGITYFPENSNSTYVELTADMFTDNVILQYNTQILTSLLVQDTSLNGLTFTLGSLYSGYCSLAIGYPVSFRFAGSTGGKILLKDIDGNTILDNTSGAYANKTVSVRWNGYNYSIGKHIWEVHELGASYATEKYVESYAQPKGDYVLATELSSALPTLTVTGIDADGVSHSWTMYGVAK